MGPLSVDRRDDQRGFARNRNPHALERNNARDDAVTVRLNQMVNIGEREHEYVRILLLWLNADIVDQTRRSEPRRRQQTDGFSRRVSDRQQGLRMASLKIVKLKADAPDRLAPFSQNRLDRMPGRELFAAERKH